MKKKSSLSTVLIVLAILILPGLISEISEADEFGALLFFILILAVLVLSVARKMIKPSSGENTGSERRSFAKKEPRIPEDPRMKTFTKPDAPCIVCEHTGEDHLARDKANRIRQLDDWLKSGLIDRSEYRVLKERYEKDL